MSASAPGLTPVLRLVVELGTPVDLGVTRAGRRQFTPIVGGTISGLAPAGPLATLRATIAPGGGDHQRWRAGIGEATTVEIDAGYHAMTASGEPLVVRVVGVRRPVAGHEPGVYFRATVAFETPSPELAGLQESVFIADGIREADSVVHTVYRVD